MRKISSSFSTILLSLSIILFISEIQGRKLQQICSSSCEDIKNISYPFRLKSDPVGCGLHNFELSCQSNKTILEFHSGTIPEVPAGKYYVKRISYNESIISLVDMNVAHGNCSLPNNSLSINDVASYRAVFGLARNKEYTNACFVRCSKKISDPAYRKVPCMRGNQSPVYVIYGGCFISDLLESCSFISMVPVHYENEKYPSYETIRKLVDSGFDLGWSGLGYTCYKNADGLYICSTTAASSSSLKLLFQGLSDSFLRARYTYAEIMAVTNNFKEKLGQGGFGSVYRGQLGNGCFIAVKVLENSKFSAEEFINEVSTIGRIHHVNVVQLVAYYSEESKRALVYEYMPNGSLDRHLFSKEGKGRSFSWEKLREIALGIARGIEYLHGGCDVCILHFDIKPHNILLDHNFIPKVSDFGLAKFYPKENDFVTVSATRGTIGYIAPELISRTFGVVSRKSDVYSFGMLLLEMAGRRRNSLLNATRSSNAYFPSWAYDQINMGGDLELQNVTETEAAIARKLCIIGLWCIQLKAEDRPSMTRVVEMLEATGTTDLPMPPKPFFCSSQRSSTGEIQPYSSTSLPVSESTEEYSLGANSNV